ncbi:MAG TPA: PEP-utilizing enzyme, partial [Bacteroidia bacterium]|nr:PEP-utilizing enzyme [Bacteroidia bacterium]
GEIIKELPKYPDLEKPFNEYLKKFGDRCLEELKLETKPFGQAPEKLMTIIKGHVLAGISDKAFDSQKVRQEAEGKFTQYYKNKLLKRQIAFHVLKGARRLVSNRENLRFERTRVFGLVRKMFRGIGNDFYKQNLIYNPDDIFYLTKEEIFNFIKGTAVSANLKELISARKNEYAAFAAAPQPASRIKTTGIVYTGDFIDKTESVALTGQLIGIGCCRGIVKAKVRVVKDPSKETSLGGDILVTENTDPGWVTLFPSASGILVERGSLLSHSAILSREMGLPCIVGVAGLLASLKTGDVVEMNGETGIIKIIADE